MTQSKAVKGESGVITHATIINDVFESHRKCYHYSIKKRNPLLYETIMKETKKVPLDILIKSYHIYKEFKQKNDKLPHPNYFLKVVKSTKITETETKQVWGKTI